VPGQLVAPLEERLAQVGVAAAVADVPLAGGDDLERLVALLVELRRVRWVFFGSPSSSPLSVSSASTIAVLGAVRRPCRRSCS
jgi:hypothetical protein